MKFCLLVTVALDIFIKEKHNTFIFLGFLLCNFSMQKVSTRSNEAEREPINHFPNPLDIPTSPPPYLLYTQNSNPLPNRTPPPTHTHTHVYSGR